eukprot:CAMPEP_0201111430 /NCGR_PEP_ID=MMETSP0812-20130820/74768_1 /ASSEMBLY_ACC=CAM_ASM_000668 /TAXON_ID=98059 /ORGANISM="Dinobryon sp., Strain UTEXLB2267" /LENGTH=70 /DNA_ID=CAMNT_0047374395 /DNA_START=198 /DNA_END=407 /DNA_ORIENTATION=+
MIIKSIGGIFGKVRVEVRVEVKMLGLREGGSVEFEVESIIMEVGRVVGFKDEEIVEVSAVVEVEVEVEGW